MTDTAVTNGKQSGAVEMSPEEYKELCKRLRQYQIKKGSKRKSAPVMKSLGNTLTVKREFLLSEAPIDWDELTIGSVFARDTKGYVLYVKSGKNQARCLNTGKPERVGGASIHRVFL